MPPLMPTWHAAGRLLRRARVLVRTATRCAVMLSATLGPMTMHGTAGEIRGRIVITHAGEPAAAHAHRGLTSRYGSRSEAASQNDATEAAGQSASGTHWTLSERAVVYLEGESLDRATYAAPERHPRLDQKNLEFHPEVLPIVVGTTVDFPNRDDLFHNVFSYSQPKEFDLGRYPRNDSRSVTFDHAGVVRVYCDIHSQMSATILVLRNPHFAVPEHDGSFVLRDVPEGRYTLVFWFDREAVERRTVEVRGAEPTMITFTY